MAAIIKSIALGKKDAVLYKWRTTVLEKEERILSFIIKRALLTFVREGSFLEIGRIHFNPEKDIPNEKARINLWLDDIPELVEWTKDLENKNIAVTKAYKGVLQRCIKIVPANEKIYIPSYYDFIGIDSLIGLNNIHPEQIITEHVTERRSITEKITTPVKSIEVVTAVENTSNNSKSVSKKDDRNILDMLGLNVRK